MWIIRGYLRMLPRLMAEEALRAQQIIAVAMGASEGPRIVGEWQRQARPETPRARPATEADLAAIGIRVTTAPAPNTAT